MGSFRGANILKCVFTDLHPRMKKLASVINLLFGFVYVQNPVHKGKGHCKEFLHGYLSKTGAS